MSPSWATDRGKRDTSSSSGARPWPSARPRSHVPWMARLLLGVAALCSLTMITGVVLLLLSPPDPDAARTIPGDELFTSGNAAAAVAEWRRELETEPTAELWARVGIGEIALGNEPAARDAFEKALALDADRVDALSNLARIEAVDDLAAAMRLLDHAESVEPHRTGIRLVRGQIYLEHGEIDAARAAFIDELNLNPSSARAWIELRRCDEMDNERKESGRDDR